MANSLVSVVVPTFNRGYCLPKTLDSILAQTHQNLEIIIVDDGSTDNTRDLITIRYGEDARIRYTFQQNQGVTAARNHGLQQAQGEYIALLDSDDIWTPWKLQLQLACFERCPEIGLVWSDMEAIAPDGRVIDKSYLRTMYHAYRWFTNDQLFSNSYPIAQVAPELASLAGRGTLFTGDIFSQMVMGNLVHTSTVVLRRERLNRVQGYQGYSEEMRIAGEDYDFHLRICKEGPVGFINLATIQYQTGMPDQITRDSYKLLHAAKNCLKTILPPLKNDRARIRLSPRMIRARLAEVHEWIGEVALEMGQSAEARRHLFASLCHQPLQPRAMCMLALYSLPFRLGYSARNTFRSLKSRIRRVPLAARQHA
jgi:glycosyltransferase involved in cell wall biosynthesis